VVTPEPRKCGTRQCDHAPVEPVLKLDAIDQSTGKLPGWVFDCPCGEIRIIPAK
jgi:hypothetical protein